MRGTWILQGANNKSEKNPKEEQKGQCLRKQNSFLWKYGIHGKCIMEKM